MKLLIERIVKLLTLLIFCVAMVGCNPANKNSNNQTSGRPNIIFVMSDDHAMNAISSYGNSVNHTPISIGLLMKAFALTRVFAPMLFVLPAGQYYLQENTVI